MQQARGPARSGAKLEVRNATPEDVEAIVDLSRRVYPDEPPYRPGTILGQITAFREGQFVVLYEGQLVGYAASFIVDEALAFADHSWASITGGGHAARHDPKGDWLYGMEVIVDGARRRLRLAHRLYEARKGLVQAKDLKGVAFGGRLPGFHRRRRKYPTPEAYLQAVIDKDIQDPVASFQMRQGFEPIRVLRDYLPEDRESGGAAALMAWKNPYYDPEMDRQPVTRADPEIVRVCSVQLQSRAIKEVREFFETVEYFVDVAADYQSDFVVFPELFTLQLMSCETKKLAPAEAIARLTEHTPQFVETLKSLAIGYNINIIGGSHPTRMEDGDIHNVGYVFLRDGSVHAQEKLHPTPDERSWWNIQGGDRIEAIPTDCGPIGVMICYDSEFPELARRLVDQGARILFTPFATDTRQGYLRVRYCCQARAVENQCYVVTAGNIGNLPNVENMDVNYAQSAILTPCDFPFARDGVAAEASENVEMVCVADLDLSSLNWARTHGSVRNLSDRRFDLYRTIWADGG
ncbi:MAG: carbon-nitrogen hydrolase family protein [Pseudomonadota bacterium]